MTTERYRPLEACQVELIRAREQRRNLPSVDWASVAAAGDWVVLATFSEETPFMDRMREFERLRKQARTFNRRGQGVASVKRINRATVIAGKVVA